MLLVSGMYISGNGYELFSNTMFHNILDDCFNYVAMHIMQNQNDIFLRLFVSGKHIRA